MHKKSETHWKDISELWQIDGWANPEDRTEFNFIDLFSGAGGLSCGMVMAGFNPVASVEIMDAAVKTYKYNFVDCKGFQEVVETRDIRKEEVKQDLYTSVQGKHIHVIVGGFPCQGFSMAGLRVVDDPRNSLYKEMKEIVQHIQPDYVVMENVEGLRSMLDGAVEKQIIQDFREIGYDINVATLNSADYYVPQTRKRVIFIGNRIGQENSHPLPLLSKDKYITLGQAIGKYESWGDVPKLNHTLPRHSPEMVKRLLAVPEGKSLYPTYSESAKKSPWDKPSCTIKENHGMTNIHPHKGRCLTARECAALQSFPDDFIFKGAKKWQLTQIGNAVPPLLGKAVGLCIRESLTKVSQ